MRRRELITLFGGAATWPLVAHAQQPAMSVIGWLSSGTPRTFSKFLKAFQQGPMIIANELATKRLKLLYDLDPGIRNAAFLVNPESPTADVEIENVKAAAGSTGRPFFVLEASSDGEINTAFASAVEKQVRALVISPDPFFMTRRAQIVGLAANYKMLVIYAFREFVDDGGLMSYGPSLASGYRVAGLYAGRILNGTKPGDLPIEAR